MPTCWFVQAASLRHTLVPDGVSYLDIARACARGNWAALINGYWSPLYPLILSPVLGVIKPFPYRELAVVQYVNCGLLLVTLALFEYFLFWLRKFIETTSATALQDKPFSFALTESIGYSLFFWATLFMIPPSLVTPDVLVTASLLLSGAALLKIANGADGWFSFAMLGLSLGLGYLAKAVMFPVSFVIIGVSALYFGKRRRSIPRLVLSSVVFLTLSSPVIISLSGAKGRFTFGDTGAINYAEFVDGVKKGVHWQGGPAGSGIPKHPTRKLLSSPPVYEFGSPVGGTYPPWFDPSYWYDGVRPHVDVGGQLHVLRLGLDSYFQLFTRLGCLVAGFLFVLLCERRLGSFLKRILKTGFLWVPAFAAIILYSLVRVEDRFLPGFVILIWASAFAALRVSDSGCAVVRCVSVVVVLLLGVQVAWSSGHSVMRLASSTPFSEWEVAEQLRLSGIKRGDRIASIGLLNFDCYYAQLAGVCLVAEIPPEGIASFTAAGPDTKAHVLDLFRQVGAKAVLAADLPSEALAGGWKRIGNTGYCILVFDH
jgi:hypothetical protein